MRLATAWTRNGQTALFGESDGKFHNLSTLLPDVVDVGSLIESRSVEAARDAVSRVNSESGVDLNELVLAPPVLRPRAIVCIGRNYPEHVKEGRVPTPEYPLLFSKYSSTLVGDGGEVPLHSLTNALDYEGELAIVVGRTAQRLTVDNAMDYVAGYTIVNDVSARDLQDSDMQWIRGKSLDGFCPVGPTFVTANEISSIDSLVIETTVNGETRQDEPCSEMIFSVPELLAFITEAITLQPGDIVSTGTPSGTGIGFDPPKYLSVGDQVAVSIEPIGTLTCTIVDPQ